jgi:transcriptional regulator of aromatic amino acid metabolism
MNWATHHTESERLAGAAHAALRTGDFAQAESLYLAAGKAEQAAFDSLEPSKQRTRGITAVSAVSRLPNRMCLFRFAAERY